MISVTNLTKSFGSLCAVNALSFEIRRGETFGLLGPNGAGKTTTIHMIIGALAPDSGTISIDGIEDPTVAEARRCIGIAPQSLALYEQLTAEENLRFFGQLYGLHGKALKDRVGWALDFAGLADRRRGRIATFSGGMKRRINLACALIHEPKVLLLDEPTVGVDPQSRNHIFESIERLSQQDLTVLYTTHYMEEAQRLCDQVAIMDAGRILALDTVDGLVTAHGGTSVVLGELESPPDAQHALPAAPDGLTLRFETTQPLQDVARLSDQGVRFTSLRVDRPDLESVFLSLTGRTLRD